MTTSALVLSGGWALGIAHLGVVSSLVHHGYEFDWYVWVSAWAIIAAGLAVWYTPEELKKIIFETKLLSLAFDFSWQRWWFLSGKKVRSELETIFWQKTFEDTRAPLTIWATNYETGEQIRINQWLIVDAVEASISIPLLFTPFYHPEYRCYCVDGGLSHNFPVDFATKYYIGSTILWVDVNSSLDSLTDAEWEIQQLTLANNLQRVFRIFFRHQPLPDDPRVTIIRPELSEFTSFDIFHLEKMWQRGYESFTSPEKQP